jgi:hypothetical protein
MGSKVNDYQSWINEEAKVTDVMILDELSKRGVAVNNVTTSREKANGTLRMSIPLSENPKLLKEILDEWDLNGKILPFDMKKWDFGDPDAKSNFHRSVQYRVLTIYARGAVRTYNASSDLFKFSVTPEGIQQAVDRIIDYVKADTAFFIAHFFLKQELIADKVINTGKSGDFDPADLAGRYTDSAISSIKELRKNNPVVYQAFVKYLIYMGYLAMNPEHNPDGGKIGIRKKFREAEENEIEIDDFELNDGKTKFIIYPKIRLKVGRKNKKVSLVLEVDTTVGNMRGAVPSTYTDHEVPIFNSIDQLVWDKLKAGPKNYQSPEELYGRKKTAIKASQLGLL